MWDSCAGDAIIQSMGGHYVTYQNKPMVYDPKSPGHVNKDGQICTLHKEVLDSVIEYMKNKK
jgi:3'-phosphoadenosine 5'-phosphosulfate (PAPS) 3'-phosphatase